LIRNIEISVRIESHTAGKIERCLIGGAAISVKAFGNAKGFHQPGVDAIKFLDFRILPVGKIEVAAGADFEIGGRMKGHVLAVAFHTVALGARSEKRE
jgi:hypothetical protein